MPRCERRCDSRHALGWPRESPRVRASTGPKPYLRRLVLYDDGLLRRHERLASRDEAASR